MLDYGNIYNTPAPQVYGAEAVTGTNLDQRMPRMPVSAPITGADAPVEAERPPRDAFHEFGEDRTPDDKYRAIGEKPSDDASYHAMGDDRSADSSYHGMGEDRTDDEGYRGITEDLEDQQQEPTANNGEAWEPASIEEINQTALDQVFDRVARLERKLDDGLLSSDDEQLSIHQSEDTVTFTAKPEDPSDLPAANRMALSVYTDMTDTGAEVKLVAGRVFVGKAGAVTVAAQAWAVGAGGTVTVTVTLTTGAATKAYGSPAASSETTQVYQIAAVSSTGVVTPYRQGDIYIDLF